MVFRILLIYLLIASSVLSAETRVWRSADGTKSIDARFLKRDGSGVTVRRSDQRVVTIPLEKIHRDDREWLDARHPLPVEEPPPAAHLVLGILEFGDSRAQVMEKLKTSELVKTTLPESLLARTGLNGVFRTVRKVGGFEASLHFDWYEMGGLKEITLQTEPVSGADIKARLKPCWEEFIGHLTTLHGPPIQANRKFDLTAVPAASMSATHLWKLEDRGTAMLGPARGGDGYQIAIRYTAEDIKPVIIPAAHPAAGE